MVGYNRSNDAREEVAVERESLEKARMVMLDGLFEKMQRPTDTGYSAALAIISMEHFPRLVHFKYFMQQLKKYGLPKLDADDLVKFVPISLGKMILDTERGGDIVLRNKLLTLGKLMLGDKRHRDGESHSVKELMAWGFGNEKIEAEALADVRV